MFATCSITPNPKHRITIRNPESRTIIDNHHLYYHQSSTNENDTSPSTLNTQLHGQSDNHHPEREHRPTRTVLRSIWSWSMIDTILFFILLVTVCDNRSDADTPANTPSPWISIKDTHIIIIHTYTLTTRSSDTVKWYQCSSWDRPPHPIQLNGSHTLNVPPVGT